MSVNIGEKNGLTLKSVDDVGSTGRHSIDELVVGDDEEMVREWPEPAGCAP
jgi:hypothetical protein